MNQKMPVLSTVIVEDERQARECLAAMLGQYPRVQVTGMAGTVKEGLALLQAQQPDIAFLDIELTDGSSFEILNQLSHQPAPPRVVFTTAWDKYAIQAFKYTAFDYLLKPLSTEELGQCLDRIFVTWKTDDYKQKIASLLDQIRPSGKIRFNTQTGFILVHPDEIFYVHADGNYCDIYFSLENKELVCHNIRQIDAMLPAGFFARVNRTHLVNLACLTRVNALSGNCTLVKGNESIEIKVSLKQLLFLKRM